MSAIFGPMNETPPLVGDSTSHLTLLSLLSQSITVANSVTIGRPGDQRDADALIAAGLVVNSWVPIYTNSNLSVGGDYTLNGHFHTNGTSTMPRTIDQANGVTRDNWFGTLAVAGLNLTPEPGATTAGAGYTDATVGFYCEPNSNDVAGTLLLEVAPGAALGAGSITIPFTAPYSTPLLSIVLTPQSADAANAAIVEGLHVTSTTTDFTLNFSDITPNAAGGATIGLSWHYHVIDPVGPVGPRRYPILTP